ncbi:MAG: ABC transporter permease [Eubacteriales bacterium]|nr:ABC transporter permease [Eubacteriales bacterium]
MLSLIGYELKKIFGKRFVLISIALILFLSFIFSFSSLNSMYARDGSNEGSGRSAVKIDKEIASRYAGELNDEKVQKMLADFKPDQVMPGLNVQALYFNSTQSAIYSLFSDIEGNWNGRTVADVFGVENPKIGYTSGWHITSRNLAKVLMALSFIIILMIAPVYSGEYGGVDALILSSKYGKTKCATAKVIAAFIASLSMIAAILAFHLIFALIVYGKDGLDSSILFAAQQFSSGYIPFNITCGTVIKYQILLAFLNGIAITGISLVISALSKEKLISFALSAAIFIAPILIPLTKTNQRLLVLTPVYFTQYISILSVEQTAKAELYAVWAIPVALILGSLGAIFSRKLFAKHQVS